MTDPQTTTKRELLALFFAEALSPAAGSATRAYITNAADELCEAPKWGSAQDVETLDPMITCLNAVYDALRRDPTDVTVRQAALCLEEGLARLADLNSQVVKREMEQIGATLTAAPDHHD